MPEWLFPKAAPGAPEISLESLGLRLIFAALLGALTAMLYHVATWTRGRPMNRPFLATLMLLSVLIALVTVLIGESAARAFSLVGTLSLVRFRTIVEDTRDSAFVIFAVAVGMACALGYPLAVLLASPIVLLIALVFRSPPVERRRGAMLVLRMAPTTMADNRLPEVLGRHARRFRLAGVATARGGAALDVSYAIGSLPPESALALVDELSRLEGVQTVEIKDE